MRWMGAGVDDADRLDATGARRLLRRTARGLRPYRRRLAVSAVLVLAYTATVLAGPYLVRYGIDHGIKRGDAGALDRAVVAYAAVAAAAYVLYRLQIATIGRVGEAFLRDLRRRAFDHLQRLSLSFYDRERSGVVVSRLTSDVDAMGELVQSGLSLFVGNLLLLVLSVVVLAVVSWPLLVVSLLALPFVVAASVRFQRDSNRAYLTVRDRIGATLSDLQEGIAGVRVIQAFGREDVQAVRFARNNRKLYDAHMHSVRVSARYLPVVELAGLVSTAAVVGVGGWLVSRDEVTIGTVTFFVLTLSNLFEPVQQLSQLFNLLQSAGAGLNKVYELLDTAPDVDEVREGERSAAVDLAPRGDLDVRGASFSYRTGAPMVLQAVDLRVRAGERLALVGPTGAGKSTLAKVMARLYDPVEGTVSFAGTDLRRATLASLRRRIVVVPQEGFLFNTTIRDNVRMARAGATDDEVEAALERIGALDRFASLPDGVDTEVRERGSRLSAGEKQLVSLARAALADPAVLVLDEATSSLDPGAERAVEEAMARLAQGRTVVVIAHRLSTAERADRVGVVVGGRLVELGTHAELVAAGGHYAGLHAAWSVGAA